MNIKDTILRNKLKLSAFLIGYIMLITDFRVLDEMSIIIKTMDNWYAIFFNLIYIALSILSIKIMKDVFLSTSFTPSDSSGIKIFNYIKIMAIGSFAGFICLVGQSFVIGLLGS